MKTQTRGELTPKFRNADEIPDRYVDLCALLLPRPIHSANEAGKVSRMVDALAGFRLNQDQEDYLEAMGHFLDEYDRAHAKPLPRGSARAVLAHLMDERGLRGIDLSRILGGSRNLGAMILRGDRALTVSHIRRLSEHFGVGAAVFVD